MLFRFICFGIPVSIHWTTLILVFLFALDAFYYASKKAKNLTKRNFIIVAVLASLLVILSIVVHEASHALVANAFGYQITDAGINGAFAYVSNDIALNEIAPYQEFLIAFAGPASNITLGILVMPLIYFLTHQSPSEMTIRYFSFMNLRLARINLWPIVVLDGGHMMSSVIRALIGEPSWSPYFYTAITAVFIVYLFTKKKGRFEIEDVVDKIR